MSETTFDFTYNLNSESAQSEMLNVLGKNRVKECEPKSYFFTESTITQQADSAGAYGPENGSSTTRFNVTTVFPLTNKKAYAVTSGQVLIVPQDANKVNVFIKPLRHVDVGVPIKYFVYRGLKKSLFIGASDNILDYSPTGLTPFMAKVWADLINFNDWTTPPAAGTHVPASLFGFSTSESLDTRVDAKFFNVYGDSETDANKIYNLPIIEAGQHFGEFADDQGGFEIVLNDGFYHQEKSDCGFEFDMTYARTGKAVLDVTSIASDPDISEKIYRESVQNFLDPAAFYGAHITPKEKGEIKTVDNSGKYNSKTDIYNNILSKFYNKHVIYIYVQCNKGRSFAYDDAFGAQPIKYGVAGIVAPSNYETHNWPIIIQETQQTHANTQAAEKGINELSLQFKFKTANKNVLLYNCSGNCANSDIDGNVLKKNALLSPANINSQDYTNTINYKLLNTYGLSGNSTTTNSVASFIYINHHEEEEIEYFNNLFGPIKIEPLQKLNYNYPQQQTHNKAKNYKGKLKINGTLDNKVYYQDLVFSGIPYLNDTSPDIFKLYILKRKSFDSFDREISSFTNDYAYGEVNSPEQNGKSHYGDENYLVWKGSIIDNSETIRTLQLINFKKEGNVRDIYNFGLMGKDYNKLIYDSETDDTTNHIPSSKKNFYFHLDEIDMGSDASTAFRKYRVGVKVENFTIIPPYIEFEIFYPSPENEVIVYTTDDQFFFTKSFSDKFPYAKEFADAAIDFRPMDLNAVQEYGFDWMRLTEGNYDSYKDSILNAYREPEYVRDGIFSGHYEYGYDNPKKAFWRLKKEYLNINTNHNYTEVNNNSANDNNKVYYVPYLNMVPPVITGSSSTPSTVMLKGKMFVYNAPITRFSLQYDTNYFTVSAQFPNITAVGYHEFDIEINCIKETEDDKFICVYANSTDLDGFQTEKLAGMIKICRNSKDYRYDNLKMVHFYCKTNVFDVSGASQDGSVDPIETELLRKYLSQASIKCTIDGPFVLPLTSYSVFKAGTGAYVDGAGRIVATTGGVDPKQDFLKDLLVGPLEKYQSDEYVKVYVFDLETSHEGNNEPAGGNVQEIGKHSLCMYNNRFDDTLPHETFHALGLHHTHADSSIMDEESQKYAFPYGYQVPLAQEKKSTDNIMSYKTAYQSTSSSHWQWELLMKHLKEE